MASTKSEQANAATKPSQKPYGKIALTLKNQLLPEDKLRTTPSQVDGLDTDTETDLRIYGCELIQTAGILLKLPQVAMATGQVLLQRFYYSKSLVRHPVDQTAMACVCLASKIEEAPRRVRDVINVFSHIRQVNSNKPIAPVILDQNYIQLKNQVIKAERRVLKELGFCVHIKHPHKIIVMYLQVLGYEKHQNLMQYSWNYMNDSLRTDVFVRYQPETIACACIYLTARKLKIPLPKSPAWYLIFGVTENEIREICVRILRLYNRPKANIDNLEKKVDELCKKYQEAKVKQRVVNSGNNTPNNNGESSPTTQKSTGAHNAWGGFISRSGSHIAPPVSDKRSRSRSGSNSPAAKHHKRTSTKKNRSRSPRSPVGGRTAKKSSRKQQQQQQQQRRGGSYSRSRSVTPVKVVRKGRDKKRTPSNDRENKNDRYIDRYDKYEKNDRYKEDRYQEKERYEDKDRKEKYEKKYDREDRYRDDKERYKKTKHREDQRDRERSKDRRR